MTMRQAKKVRGWLNGGRWYSYRVSTRLEAWRKYRRRLRLSLRRDDPLTEGYRWGRWDPNRPTPPWELPF